MVIRQKIIIFILNRQHDVKAGSIFSYFLLAKGTARRQVGYWIHPTSARCDFVRARAVASQREMPVLCPRFSRTTKIRKTPITFERKLETGLKRFACFIKKSFLIIRHIGPTRLSAVCTPPTSTKLSTTTKFNLWFTREVLQWIRGRYTHVIPHITSPPPEKLQLFLLLVDFFCKKKKKN